MQIWERTLTSLGSLALGESSAILDQAGSTGTVRPWQAKSERGSRCRQTTQGADRSIHFRFASQTSRAIGETPSKVRSGTKWRQPAASIATIVGMTDARQKSKVKRYAAVG